MSLVFEREQQKERGKERRKETEWDWAWDLLGKQWGHWKDLWV